MSFAKDIIGSLKGRQWVKACVLLDALVPVTFNLVDSTDLSKCRSVGSADVNICNSDQISVHAMQFAE